MNWLAHIFLSKNSIEYQLGNLLADPLKGKHWDGASDFSIQGFNMHKKIDIFTDANEYVIKSKSRLDKKGYLKGVVIDMVYDYLLLKNWHRFSHIDITLFINQFYSNALTEIINYPAAPKEFIERIVQSQTLTSYGSFQGLEKAFIRIDKRLSKKLLAKDSTVSYMPIVESKIDNLEKDFLLFFPQLITYFKIQIESNLGNHWLKTTEKLR